MANITLKGVPEPLIEELKRHATAHRRSLNGEVIYRLERSLTGGVEDGPRFVREIERFRKDNSVRTTVADIIAARDKGRR